MERIGIDMLHKLFYKHPPKAVGIFIDHGLICCFQPCISFFFDGSTPFIAVGMPHTVRITAEAFFARAMHSRPVQNSVLLATTNKAYKQYR